MTSAERQEFIAGLIRQLLEEEATPRRCKVLPFPKRPVEPPTRELRELLDQADKT